MNVPGQAEAGDVPADSDSMNIPEPQLAGGPAGGDALAGCLEALARLLGVPASVEVLIAGLPMEGNRLTPALFVRAAERAGLEATVQRVKLEEIPALALPAVLLLGGRDACLLVAKETGGARIVSATGLARTVPIETLSAEYTGTAIYVGRSVRFEAGTLSERMLRNHHWFWGTMLRYWPIYVQVILASVMVNVFSVITPLFFMNVYDRVVPNRAIETLWVLAIGLTLIYGFDFLLKTLRGYFIDVAGKRADIALSSTLFEQVMNRRLDVGREPIGSLANNLREFDSLRDFFTSATLTTVVDLPFVLLFIGAIWAVGGLQMAAVPVLAIPVVIIGGLAVAIPLRDRIKRSFSASETKYATLIETLAAIETVKTLGAASHQQRKWEAVNQFLANESMGTKLLTSIAINFSMLVQVAVSLAVLIVGVYLIGDNKLTQGALIACTTIAGRAMQPLSQLSGLILRYHQAMSALGALNKLMDAAVERPRNRNFVHRPAFRGDIEFKDVHFKYPGQKVDALSGINLKIRAGDRVGVIGRVGSGKSTIAKLIVALYQPTSGSILIDGTDSRQLDPADVRRNIGYVPQNLILFSGTVRENLMLGAPQADDAALLRAAEMSGLDEHINRHPLGFDLTVGERGEALSGGQRQTVVLARALVPDPPILVFDEPTQALDHSAEDRLKGKLEKEMGGKTVIIVTHRESMLTCVNTLVIVDSGKIVAAGPREAVVRALAEGRIQRAR